MPTKPDQPDPATGYALGVIAGTIPAGKLVILACQRHINDLTRQGSEDFPFVWEPWRGRRLDDFCGLLRQYTGEWAGEPLTLAPFQQFVAYSIFSWVKDDGMRRFKTAVMRVPRKNGKALALDTPIPIPSGWTTMGELREGDRVFDESGAVCNVTGVTETMFGRECFEVVFSDGEKIIADAEHLWETTPTRTGRAVGTTYGGKKNLVFTTAEIRETLLIDCPAYVRDGKLEYNHKIRTAKALELPDVELPIPPYVMGAWLGDGHSRAARIVSSENDIGVIEMIRRAGVEAVEHTSRNRVSNFQIGPNGHFRENRETCITAKLRGLGALNNKHVPLIYLRSSKAQRMELMRGLMDTDGHASKAGQCEFTTISPALRDGFTELARSLGFKPSTKTARATINGRDCGEKYRIQFWAYQDWPVFHLARKRARLKPSPPRPTRASYRQIIAVNPVPSVPVRCIAVDSPNHLYLAGAGMIPTHNTTFSAGVALYLLSLDNEPGAQIFAAATKRDQARLVFRDACKMLRRTHRKVRDRFVEKVSLLEFPSTDSRFEPLSADSDKLDGLNPHAAICDETHAWPTRDLWDVLQSGMGARRQPLMLDISTAGNNTASFAYETHKRAEDVLQGTKPDESFFAYIAMADPEDLLDWENPAVWEKANPGYGTIKPKHYFETEAAKVRATPSALTDFLTKQLNIWANASERWLDPHDWEKGNTEGLAEALRGRKCSGALDLGKVSDLSAFALIFPPNEVFAATGVRKYALICWHWCPGEDIIKRSREDRVPYDAWERSELITRMPGNTTDYAAIRTSVEKICPLYQVQDIAFDRMFAGETVQGLQDAGITMVEFGQGFLSMAGPTVEFERLVKSGSLLHADSPLLAWEAGNVCCEVDAAGNIKPSKKKSREKIDGIVSGIMALGRVMAKEEKQVVPTVWVA